MSFQAQLVMVLWPFVVLFIFAKWSPQKAILIAFIAAILFLPQQAGFVFNGFPDYTKTSAPVYSILLAALICDFKKVTMFKFSWLDVPMLIFCFSPVASSLTNGLGLYDGLSSSLEYIVAYGLPYFMGRLYLTTSANLKELLTFIFIGGLIYAPLCLFEIRMSPVLHKLVYGYLDAQRFAQTIRLGGFRPVVFMDHGLVVALWMCIATICGFYLWQSGVVKKLWSIPMVILWGILLVTFLLLKSTGAYLYLAIGLAIFASVKFLKTRLVLLGLVFVIVFYIFIGATGLLYQGSNLDNINNIATTIFNEDRAQSLIFRMENEQKLSEKARIRVWFGWGGWGRNRIQQENWAGDLEDLSVTDSLWGILFGTNGLLGLVPFFVACLLPTVVFCLKYSPKLWLKPKLLPGFTIATFTALYILDNVFNASPNPVYMIGIGGLTTFLVYDKNPVKAALPKRPVRSVPRVKSTLAKKQIRS